MTPPLSERLQFLFDTVYPFNGRPYTRSHVAQHASNEHVTVSVQQITGILSGRTASPRFDTMVALARFFNVPIDYFSTDDPKTWNDYRSWITRTREAMDNMSVNTARSLRWVQLREQRKMGNRRRR